MSTAEGGAGSSSLRKGVATGTENVVTLRSFWVAAIVCPERWDPSTDRLPTSYTVFDPNAQVRRGRLAVYPFEPPPPGDDADPDVAMEVGAEMGPWSGQGASTIRPGGPLYTLALTREEFAHGDHDLDAGRRWDGKISGRQSLVSVLDAPLWIRIELWNTDTDNPPNEAGTDTAPASHSSERVSALGCRVDIDVVVKAVWSRKAVIPANDPDEQEKGKVSLDLKLRNIPDGTFLELVITRIVDAAVPGRDRVYEFSGRDPSGQSGLEELVVRDGTVKNGAGRAPEVAFLNFPEHWKYPGNNFYCAWIRVVGRSTWLPVTERDYKKSEADCLHMRFVVLVHLGSRDVPHRVQTAEKLATFLNKETKYFHAILKTTPSTSAVNYHEHFRNRYIVVFLGHCGIICAHPEHGSDPKTGRLDHFHSGFPPRQLVCPNTWVSDEARRAAEREAKHYLPRKIGLGCGNGDQYYTMPVVGRSDGRRLLIVNSLKNPVEKKGYLVVGAQAKTGDIVDRVEFDPGDVPRFLYYAGGCRTMTTESLARFVNHHGTRYVHGWAYSVSSIENPNFVMNLLRRWIKETGSDHGLDEWEPRRFLEVYRQLATQEPGRRYAPQLRSESGLERLALAPDAADEALV